MYMIIRYLRGEEAQIMTDDFNSKQRPQYCSRYRDNRVSNFLRRLLGYNMTENTCTGPVPPLCRQQKGQT